MSSSGSFLVSGLFLSLLIFATRVIAGVWLPAQLPFLVATFFLFKDHEKQREKENERMRMRDTFSTISPLVKLLPYR